MLYETTLNREHKGDSYAIYERGMLVNLPERGWDGKDCCLEACLEGQSGVREKVRGNELPGKRSE